MPKLTTASFKQRKFVNIYLKTGNKIKAAEEAYGTHNYKTSQSLANQTLKHPMTVEYMKRILDKAGMTDDQIANGLKMIADAGLRENSLKGARPADTMKAYDMALKLKDLYPAEKKNIEKKTLSIKYEGKTPQELQDMLKLREDEIRKFRNLLKSDIVEGEIDDSNLS